MLSAPVLPSCDARWPLTPTQPACGPLPRSPSSSPSQVRKLGANASPAALKALPLASGAMWAFYGSYLAYVMFSTAAPGLPVWQVGDVAMPGVVAAA